MPYSIGTNSKHAVNLISQNFYLGHMHWGGCLRSVQKLLKNRKKLFCDLRKLTSSTSELSSANPSGLFKAPSTEQPPQHKLKRGPQKKLPTQATLRRIFERECTRSDQATGQTAGAMTGVLPRTASKTDDVAGCKRQVRVPTTEAQH